MGIGCTISRTVVQQLLAKEPAGLELSNPSSRFKGCSCELSQSKGTAGAGHAVYSTDTAEPLQCLYWHPSLYKHCCHRRSRLAAIRAALDPEKYPKAQEKSSFSHIVIPSIKCLPSQVTQQLKLSLARLPTQFTPAQNIWHWTRCHPSVHSQLRGFGAVLLVLALKVFEGSFIPLIFVLTPKTTDPLYT